MCSAGETGRTCFPGDPFPAWSWQFCDGGIYMIYDITQPLFGCKVFPGDPCPEKIAVMNLEKGDICSLTRFSMCAHNGTHVDAPAHFIRNGKTVEQVEIEKMVGPAYVRTCDGEVSGDEAKRILDEAGSLFPDARQRILIRGRAVVTEEAARVFAKQKIGLIGNESQTFGPENAPAAVHRILLSAEIVLLEGICLSEVKDGAYFLFAAPINLNGCEGAPCRAVLTDELPMLKNG